MNFRRMFIKMVILLLIVFIVSCTKVVTVSEKPVERSPVDEIKSQKKETPPETNSTAAGTDAIKPPEYIKPKLQAKQFEEKQQEEKPPALQFPEDRANRNIIGCILPLSGRYGDDGNKALDAILLAAGMFDEKNKTPWKIVVADSRGSQGEARSSVAQLVRTENVMAIIAVAGSAEAAAIAREADNWKIPIVLVTPKEGVSISNDYVFQHFLTPNQQIKALLKYSLDQLNCAVFSVLYPQDDYGAEMAKIFRAETERSGGKIEMAIPYSKTQTDFTEEIKKITKDGLNKKADFNNPEAEGQVTVDFEALFIPDSYQRVKMITSQLAFYNVKGFRLLGTSLWNTPDLLKKGAEHLEGAVFADSFFVNSFYPEANDFVDIYYTAYGREPGSIEALAYDTTGIILKVLEDEEIKTRAQFVTALKKVENYQGVTGNISFFADKIAQKTALILQVKDGKLEQVQ